MKKSFLLLALACVASCFEANADANVYASALKATSTSSSSYEISFMLNAPASKVSIKIYNNGTLLKTFDKGAFDKGVNTTTLDMTGITEKNLNWAIEASATPVTTPTLFSDASQPSQQYKAAVGLVANVNPESPYFGNIYVSEAIGATLSDTRTTTDGIFILDAAMNDVGGQGGNAYRGNVSWAQSATSVASPMRIALDEEGYLFITDWSDTNAGIWIMDPANPSADFKPVFGGTRNADGLASEGDVAIHGSISNCYIEGSGADRKLYTYDEDYTVNGIACCILRYDIGTLSNPWATAPSAVAFNNADTYAKNANGCFYPDLHGGWWLCQYRYTDSEGIPSIMHINAAGAVDYRSGSLGDIVNRSAGMNADRSLLAIGGNKKIVVFKVEYGEGAPILTELYTITEALGVNNYAIAFDYADNIYIGSSGITNLTAFALPCDNCHETPAPKNMTINGAGSIVEELKTEKVNAKLVGSEIMITTAENINKVAVFSMSGSTMYNAEVGKDGCSIDTESWNAGMYIVKVNNQVFKVVK